MSERDEAIRDLLKQGLALNDDDFDELFSLLTEKISASLRKGMDADELSFLRGVIAGMNPMDAKESCINILRNSLPEKSRIFATEFEKNDAKRRKREERKKEALRWKGRYYE